MGTRYQRSGKTGTEENPVFNSLGNKPRAVSPENIEECDPPIDRSREDGKHETYYLIARINGVKSRGPRPEQTEDRACLLYVSEDKEAFEVDCNAVAGDWSEIPRKITDYVPSAKPANGWIRKAFEVGMKAHSEADIDAE